MSAHIVAVRGVTLMRRLARGDERLLRRFVENAATAPTLRDLQDAIEQAVALASLPELEQLADLAMVASAGLPRYRPQACAELRTLITSIAMGDHEP